MLANHRKLGPNQRPPRGIVRHLELRSWLCPDDVAGTRPAPRCSQLSWPRFPRSLSVSGLRSLYKPRLAFLLVISIGGTLQTLLSSSPCIKKKKKKKKKSERY
ncbi:hypothetical protein BHE74_00022034 [Ensete ventricosum]|nr:hypothetical protein BHE74_00022034 [Ensete ventricosum]